MIRRPPTATLFPYTTPSDLSSSCRRNAESCDRFGSPGLTRHPRDTSLLVPPAAGTSRDRKSTRLNSSHTVMSYAVFCLKKNKDFGWTARRTACDHHDHHLVP